MWQKDFAFFNADLTLDMSKKRQESCGLQSHICGAWIFWGMLPARGT
jgi:hypothetical protein